MNKIIKKNTLKTEKIKILVVEDEPVIALNIRNNLLECGYEVPEVMMSGEEAIVKVKDLKPDIIIMDITLQTGLDGIETANEINRIYNIPVIYLTGNSNSKIIEMAISTNPYGYHVKPVELNELNASIKIALSRFELEKKLYESEERFRRQYKNLPVPTVTWQQCGDDFMLADFNEAFEELTEGKIKDFIGTLASEFYHDEPGILEDLSKCFNERKIINRELNHVLRITGKTKVFYAKYYFIPPDFVIIHTEDITERKKTEEELELYRNRLEVLVARRTDELRESKELYHNLFNNKQICLFRSKIDGSAFLAVNKKVCDVLGYSYEELMAIKPSDLWANKSKREEMIHLLNQFGNLSDYKIEIITKKGTVKNFLQSIKMYPEKGYLEGCFLDITEIIENKKKLEQNSYLLETILESTADGILVIGENGRVLHYNEKFLKFWNVPEKLINTGESSKLLHHAMSQLKKPDEFIQKVNSLYKSNEISLDNIFFKDGRILARYSCPLKEENQIKGRIWSFRDITEKESMEKLIKENKERLNLALKAVNDGIWDRNLKTDEIYFSPRCYTMLGYYPYEMPLTRKTWMNLIHYEDRDYVLEKVDGIINKNSEYNIEFRMKTKQGEWKWIMSRGKIVEWTESGEALRIIGTHTDITGNKKNEERIMHLTNELMESQEIERQRVAKDLHDGVGQTILASKINFQEYIRKPEKRMNRFNAGIEFINQACRELREIYNDLFPSILSDIGLEAAVRWYAKNSLNVNGINVELEFNIKRTLNDKIKVNLYRIIQEIFSNIIKHSNSDLIILNLNEDKNGCLMLIVTDNGLGFEYEKTINESSGLGLISIRQRVESIKGELEIITSPGRGVIITITIKKGWHE